MLTFCDISLCKCYEEPLQLGYSSGFCVGQSDFSQLTFGLMSDVRQCICKSKAGSSMTVQRSRWEQHLEVQKQAGLSEINLKCKLWKPLKC